MGSIPVTGFAGNTTNIKLSQYSTLRKQSLQSNYQLRGCFSTLEDIAELESRRITT